MRKVNDYLLTFIQWDSKTVKWKENKTAKSQAKPLESQKEKILKLYFKNGLQTFYQWNT